ncbi:hypothetical protein AND_008817 [Anopheles darlingi]|uniref:SAM domain-containing protein n=1 Tax=Anopheles darlingi TaxID=43151 RepID=W5J6F1_ANODA|nr:uncharacterized protein LOC125954655 [Anopheles darlingi]ETN59581.1 hypothetical protein AND_008817 [Anopheles darlingi]
MSTSAKVKGLAVLSEAAAGAAGSSNAAMLPSPIIKKISPNGACTQDVSFEAYKQPKNKSKRRSFSPMVHQAPLASPDLSPIEMSEKFGLSPRLNTPRTVPHVGGYQPGKPLLLAKPPKPRMHKKLSPKEDSGLSTPVVKRELEHRICVSNILQDMGLSKYIRIFTNEEINFEVFLTLCEKDLHDIGIHCQEDIEKILAKITDYNMSGDA